MLDANHIFIFGLVDPRDDVMFYIGQSKVGKKEPDGYIAGAHRGSTSRKVKRYLRHLYHLGLKAYWVEIESCTLETVDDAEIFWIAFCRATGADITNMTDGGQKNATGYRHTAESKAIISAKSKLKVMSADARRRIGEGTRGRVKTEVELEKLRKPRPGMRGKATAWKKGVPLSNETRLRMIAEGKSIGRPKKEYVERKCSVCPNVLRLCPGDRRLKNGKLYCSVPCYKRGLTLGFSSRDSKNGKKRTRNR